MYSKEKLVDRILGLIILSYFHNNARIQDTASIDGKFTFTGEIIEPTQAILNGGNELNTVWIYLEPSNMKISLSKDKFEECKMTGSKTQIESDLLNKMKEPFNERLSVLRIQINKINDSINQSMSNSSKILLEKKSQEIDNLWSQTVKKIDSPMQGLPISGYLALLLAISVLAMGFLPYAIAGVIRICHVE